MSATDEAGAYEPRLGDWVTVRRWIKPTTGERTLHGEYAGRITDVQPEADGHLIWLDTLPAGEWIFTGYQFLGQGTDGKGPASLVTEVTPTELDGLRIQLTPDLALLLDASQCIVLEVTDPAAGGEALRRITVTDVDAFKAGLHDVREAQRAVLREADLRRVAGPDEKRRAEGRYTKTEAAAFLFEATHAPRSRILAVLIRAPRRHELGREPERFGTVQGEFLVSYDGSHWVVVPAASETVR